jgi:NarL family two-component system response regulator YdfI
MEGDAGEGALVEPRRGRSLRLGRHVPLRGTTVIKVLVSANSPVELAGLESLVRSAAGLELAGSCLGRADLAAKLAATHPDVLLESPGPAALDDAALDSEAAMPPSVWLAPRSEFGLALDAVRDSAVQGVLPAWAGARAIEAAIEAVARGLVVLDPELAVLVGGREALPPGGSGEAAEQVLSPRESEILGLLASGLGNKEIAWRLKISEHTVKFHITSVFNKLSVSSRAEAVATGIRRGLISL